MNGCTSSENQPRKIFLVGFGAALGLASCGGNAIAPLKGRQTESETPSIFCGPSGCPTPSPLPTAKYTISKVTGSKVYAYGLDSNSVTQVIWSFDSSANCTVSGPSISGNSAPMPSSGWLFEEGGTWLDTQHGVTLKNSNANSSVTATRDGSVVAIGSWDLNASTMSLWNSTGTHTQSVQKNSCTSQLENLAAASLALAAAIALGPEAIIAVAAANLWVLSAYHAAKNDGCL